MLNAWEVFMITFNPMKFLSFTFILSVLCLNFLGAVPNETNPSNAIPSNQGVYNQNQVNQPQTQLPANNQVNPQLNQPNVPSANTPQFGSRAEQDALYNSFHK